VISHRSKPKNYGEYRIEFLDAAYADLLSIRLHKFVGLVMRKIFSYDYHACAGPSSRVQEVLAEAVPARDTRVVTYGSI
jgi:hypothetical protein